MEDLEKVLEDEDKADFLRFLRRMLRWLPEINPQPNELEVDPLLTKYFQWPRGYEVRNGMLFEIE